MRICYARISRYAAVVCLPAILLAQTPPSAHKRAPGATSPSAYKLTSIKVTGTSRYTPEEVANASGLHIGENVSEEDFKQATQRLGETGLFSDVAYTYAFSSAGTKLELQVKENDQLIPLVFDNFPWFSDQELIGKIHAQIPLFKGQLPVDGNVIDQVADLLAALMVEHNPHFHVQYLRSAESAGPIQAIVFTVNGAQIRMHNVVYPGASASQVPALEAATKKILNEEYFRSRVALFAKFDLRPIYLKQGYLKASFAPSDARVISETPDQTVVDVNVPVDEDHQYKLGKILWSGNTVFPESKLQPLIHVQTGQPANAVQLSDDMKAVRDLYGTRGYVKAVPEMKADFDESDNSVTYTIAIKEGEQYTMGEIEFEGVDDKTRARLRLAWQLTPGQPYDSSYSKRFLDDANSYLPSEGHWAISVREAIEDQDKTVDVTLRFARKSD
jgi:outer membrane protein assembly factor BamA